jgi:hypothetical protein
MKWFKYLSIGMLASLLSLSAYAETVKITKEEVPSPVIDAFQKQYPSAVVDIYNKTTNAADSELFELRFKTPEASFEVLYYPDGKLYKTVEVLKGVSALPQLAQDYIAQNHSNIQFKRFTKVTRPATGIEYLASAKDVKVLFDEGGNLKSKT